MYIRLWQCESYHQHQNLAERRWQTLKTGTNRLLNFTGAPRNFALAALIFYAFVLNHTVDAYIGDGKRCGTMSPYMMATGCSDDISPLLCFRFNEPVYCLEDTTVQSFPSKPKEIRARWIGVSEQVGGAMCWKVVTEKTEKILYRSSIRSALDPSLRNLSLDPLKSTDFKIADPKSNVTNRKSDVTDGPKGLTSDSDTKRDAVFFRSDGEENDAAIDYATGHRYKSIITDKNGKPQKDSNGNVMYRLGPHPSEICGKNFRLPHPETGLPTHVTIGKLIDDYDEGLKKNAVRQAHFEVKFSKDDKEDIMSYNDIVDFMSRDTTLYDGEFWHFRKILSHEEVNRRSPAYQGSKFNL